MRLALDPPYTAVTALVSTRYDASIRMQARARKFRCVSWSPRPNLAPSFELFAFNLRWFVGCALAQ